MGAACPVGPVGADGVVGVGGGDDPRAERYVLALQLLGIAGAVPAFLVVEHQRHDVHELGCLLDDAPAKFGVLADAFPFLRR